MFICYSHFLILLLFFHNISSSKALKSGFRVELIHRDSPKSPFYRPTETHFQRVQNAVFRSIHRANYLTLDSLHDVETTVIPTPGEYLMNYSVGTPPFQILGLVDTGSSTIWMQCQPCKNCYKQSRPIFDPSISSTYSSIPCVAAECLTEKTSFCKFNNGKHCAYKATYGDNSTTEGDLIWDTITLTSSSEDKPVALPKTVIGCGHNNVGIFGEQNSGIVGLGNGPYSLATQLRPKTGGTFSYCFTPMYEGDRKPSYLHFGDRGEVSVKSAVPTPIVMNNAMPFGYYLVMEAISVGSKRIEFPRNGEEGNIILDSGTVLTFLPDEVYSKLEAEMVNAVNLVRTDDPSKVLKLCYEIRSGQQYQIPTVFAHFKGGAVVELHSINTFVKMTETVICLAFSPDSTAIFGNLAQQDILVGYDTQHNTVTFLNTDCTSEL
ncbi:aspartic proteinase CDR1-like [Vigna unguiculata]|uniref:aspartic proteinase CDR1-like n=1 Tax=Vigna unguiculata TaxID=3917 RepID=UPI001016FE41|nr:aspartic proteinase CDR1-like [Vigna unguiculata]